MGHFIIELPDNKQGDVTRLIVKKIQFSKTYMLGSESPISASTPDTSFMGFKYVISISEDSGKTEYCLFKSQNGEWSMDTEGLVHVNNNALFLVRNAIVKRENEMNLQ